MSYYMLHNVLHHMSILIQTNTECNYLILLYVILVFMSTLCALFEFICSCIVYILIYILVFYVIYS